MEQHIKRSLIATTVTSLAWLGALAAPSAHAQDSFGTTPPARRTPEPAAQAPAPQRPAANQQAQPAERPIGPSATEANPRPGESNEAQDFGVRPVSQLRPSEQLHGPTPTTIPGGKVVSTRQLAQWMQGQAAPQGKVMLLHAIGSNRHLPNAIPAAPASQGGSFDDQVQRDYGAYLQQATGGDKARLLVTYCAGVQCWGSYNAALRAIQMGYTNVHWYRGGIEAWERAGLPVLTASDGSSNQQPPSPQDRKMQMPR